MQLREETWERSWSQRGPSGLLGSLGAEPSRALLWDPTPKRNTSRLFRRRVPTQTDAAEGPAQGGKEAKKPLGGANVREAIGPSPAA